MSRVRAELGLSRSALVALALLLGCDYCPGGVPGVGRQSALSLLHSCLELDPECDLLQRMRSWRDGKGEELAVERGRGMKDNKLLVEWKGLHEIITFM